MLVLARKNRESVVVGGVEGFPRLLKVTVVEISGGKVKLGFEVDAEVPVYRMEIWERMRAAGEVGRPGIRDSRARLSGLRPLRPWMRNFFKRFVEVAMGILSWIVFGLIAGVVAKYVMPGPDSGGIVMTILLGVAGAVVGGFIGTQMGYGSVAGFDVRSLLIAIGGALVLLVGFRLVLPQLTA